MRTGQPAAPWARLAAIAALYVSLGAVLGFVQGGVGPIMRGKGHALTSMAPVFALYLPFGVTFLWAPLVDRWRLPWLGRRSGWIVAAQGLAVLLVAAIALGGALPLAALFGLGLAATLAVATMDVALDAWTVEHIADAHRGAASAAKVGGLSLGAVLGGGVLVGLFPPGLGRRAAVAGRPDGVRDAAGLASARPRRASGGAAGKAGPAGRPAAAGHGRAPAAHQSGHLRADGAVQPEPADAGGPGRAAGPHRLGVGVAAPLANLAMALALPAALRRCAPRPLLWALLAATVAGALAIVMALRIGHADLAIAASIAISACVSGLYIVMGGLILGWAAGGQAATDYALLYGLGRFVGTLALLGMPALIALVGWPAFYALAAACAVLAVACFMAALRKT
ncbi:MFS transporter [Achromobacter xylosoxidans]